MKAYDCDDVQQFEKLSAMTNKVDYIKLNLIHVLNKLNFITKKDPIKSLT